MYNNNLEDFESKNREKKINCQIFLFFGVAVFYIALYFWTFLIFPTDPSQPSYSQVGDLTLLTQLTYVFIVIIKLRCIFIFHLSLNKQMETKSKNNLVESTKSFFHSRWFLNRFRANKAMISYQNWVCGWWSCCVEIKLYSQHKTRCRKIFKPHVKRLVI